MMFYKDSTRKSLSRVAACAAIALLFAFSVGCARGDEEQASDAASETQSGVIDGIVSQAADDSPYGGSVSTSVDQPESEVPPRSHSIDVAVISQYPELPNGCEITSLAIVLNYLGIPADKCDLSDNYLAKGPVGTVDFHVAFEGNPRDDDAFGCYAQAIVDAGNLYLSEQGSPLRAQNLTGTAFQDLFGYINQDIPVIIWATRYMEEGHYSVTWTVDGQDYTWFTPEHCLVLVGYDYDANAVRLADPIEGTLVEYDMSLVESRYNSLGNQAIVVM